MTNEALFDSALSCIVEFELIIDSIQRLAHNIRCKRYIYDKAESCIESYRSVQLEALKYFGIEGYKENFLCYDHKIQNMRADFICLHKSVFRSLKTANRF